MEDRSQFQLSAENAALVQRRAIFLNDLRLNEHLFWPFWRPCQVRILMVVDGLNYSEGNFGLSTFVHTLLDMPGNYVRFSITLADIRANVAPADMMAGEPRIAQRITGFKFDNPDHFKADMYHEVMLFGIAQSFFGRGQASNGQPYPTDRLADPELRVLTQHVNNGRGLFATGDHGRLGRFLCHAVPRVRNMRLWDDTSADNAANEVSMNGPRRNDTNRIGSSPGSQFDDESDDTPQVIQPQMYNRMNGIFRFRFPHPLLCGPNGPIRVMPDHPHEGECVVPRSTNDTLNIGGTLGAEYPPATDGGPRPLPEIISRSTVLSGTTSGTKLPTEAQSFGGICAYDGHRAGIGRVVTDATWHHFVNVNLVGRTQLPPDNPKSQGFLFSAQGQAHLAEIRTYYRNLAVWMAPPERIRCMNSRLFWHLNWSDRVMEAVMTTTHVPLREIPTVVLFNIGRHARDVLGRYAGQCQTVRLIIDSIIAQVHPKLVNEIDPWIIAPRRRPAEFESIDFFDGSALLDISLGAALVALREKMPEPDPKRTPEMSTEEVEKVIVEGGRFGLEAGLKLAHQALEGAGRQLKM